MSLNYSSRNYVLGLIEAVLAFVLASQLLQSQPIDLDESFFGIIFGSNGYLLLSIMYVGLGSVLVVMILLGVTRFKIDKTSRFAILFGFFGVIILFLSSIQLMGIIPQTFERSILIIVMAITGVGLIINQW